MSSTSPQLSQAFSTESYFQTQRPPAGLDEKAKIMLDFVTRWNGLAGKKVVLVTVSNLKRSLDPFPYLPKAYGACKSGGTTVPLEANTSVVCRFPEQGSSLHLLNALTTAFVSLTISLLVSSSPLIFIEDFKSLSSWLGTRGATSAEYFLKADYAVIFLHRQHSLRPFSRHYSHSLNPFLDLLSLSPSSSASAPSIVVRPGDASKLEPILRAYHHTQSQGTLLSVDFQTVNEYLWLLRAVTGSMAGLGRRGMFYLAAAVSDFFLPEEKMVR